VVFDVAQAAVEGALAAGAAYADARVTGRRTRGISVHNGVVQAVDTGEQIGVGVRALVGSSWGFFATDHLGPARARAAGEQATAIARASALVPGPDLVLSEVPVRQDSYRTPVEEHPFSVSVAEQADLLVEATTLMLEEPRVRVARGWLGFGDLDTWLVSSDGHRIHQNLVSSGGGISAMSVGDGETQIRSYPQSFGQYESGGFETIRRWDYAGNAPRIAGEAAALLDAIEMEPCEKPLVLESSQLALQIHESVGHAIELDRILGWEAAFAGTSHLELPRLGVHRYGSDLMNITADATLPGALGHFGYDDEGTPAQRVDIVATVCGLACCRAGTPPPSPGCPRAGWSESRRLRPDPDGADDQRRPAPRDSSLEEMIAATDDGYYMSTNRSWSIDDKRLNFQFGCEIGWEIKDGRLGRMVKNPTYTGITPRVLGHPRHGGGRAGVGALGDAQLREGPAAPGRPHRASGRAGPVLRGPHGGEGMSELAPIVDEILGGVPDGFEAEVVARWVALWSHPLRQLVHPSERRRGDARRRSHAGLRRPPGGDRQGQGGCERRRPPPAGDRGRRGGSGRPGE
jgi:TldD protein